MTPRPYKMKKTVIVSGEYPFLAEKLKEQGFYPISTDADKRLPFPVRFHPDMQACAMKETLFVLKNGPLERLLQSKNFPMEETEGEPADRYPKDVLCNAVTLGRFLVGNPKSLDRRILKSANKEGLTLLPVRQGYTACSMAVINSHAVITADSGIAKTLRKVGINVLCIRPGWIDLPGYDTGFIGGCCGMLQPDLMAVTGSLQTHPDGERIQRFLREENVDILELKKGALLDVGGFVNPKQ